jgi:hypothetical protein
MYLLLAEFCISVLPGRQLSALTLLRFLALLDLLAQAPSERSRLLPGQAPGVLTMPPHRFPPSACDLASQAPSSGWHCTEGIRH